MSPAQPLRIVSGGQTGADQAGWRAARRFGIDTAGWMPLGFLTEAGARPEFATLYGAVEASSASYPERTRMNVRDSDATLWFGSTGSLGYQATAAACRSFGKPMLIVVPGQTRPSAIVERLQASPSLRVLNIAGNRESILPGIGERAERFLAEVFRRLGYLENPIS